MESLFLLGDTFFDEVAKLVVWTSVADGITCEMIGILFDELQIDMLVGCEVEFFEVFAQFVKTS